MHDVAGPQVLGRAVERQFGEAVQFLVEREHGVAAVVAGADGDARGPEEDVGGVEGGEAGAVG